MDETNILVAIAELKAELKATNKQQADYQAEASEQLTHLADKLTQVREQQQKWKHMGSALIGLGAATAAIIQFGGDVKGFFGK